MLTQQKLIVSLAFVLLSACASASPIVYVLNGNGQFGTVDLGTGAFRQIGPDTLEGSSGLIPGPDGSLLTLAFSGDVDRINPGTGISSVLGKSGLGDCSNFPASPCGPSSANALGKLGDAIYATDYANNLYRVNQATGAATLIGLTGIPALPFVPGTVVNGSLNFSDETLFGVGGKLYATFDAGMHNFATSVNTTVIPPNLYQINPATGLAMLVAPTALGLTAVVNVNGTVYGFTFDGETSQEVTLNLANGNTSFVRNIDPAAGFIGGAAAVPEPASIALAGIGLAAVIFCRRRRSFSKHARGYLLTLSLALCAISSAFGQGSTFTTIDFPGATATQPWGINTRGDIVGLYTSAGMTHGFLLSGGQFSTIDFPGATETDAFAINPRGDIVGVYTSADKVSHGFLLTGSQFSTIDFPGATYSEGDGINARGEISGTYVLAGLRHAFLLSGGQFTKVDFPDTIQTIGGGLNPQGDNAGSYNNGGTHGFLLSDGDYTSIDFPGATFTNANAITARGDIVGRYVAGGVSHGYLLSGGLFSTIDFPGASFTSAASRNQRGDIVGRYVMDGVTHAFLLTSFRPACVVAMSTPRIAAVTHSSDFTLVTGSKPASAGEVLVLFVKGLGPTRPSVSPGQPFPSSPLLPVDSLVEVRVNGRSAIVFGAFGFPGAVDGYQVNFRLPPDTTKGTAAIELSAGGVAGMPVNIMVQ
ncbi:MAG: PEP-CTERM sorting domain-containing protein [Acidobacteriota bacterium]|nr:PEP-CTERM sorting domain-containing protein [Acidobacteriota bacterium]